jgi:dihydroneopterin aldolase
MSRNSATSVTVMAPARESEDGAAVIVPHRAGERWQRVRIDGMVIECLIGIHDFEHQAPQRVSIDVELVRREPDDPTDEVYARVMCYETLINKIRAIAAEGHIKLIETFAERIAEACYSEYPEISALNVTVNKIDIFTDVAKVGVRLERVFDPVPEHPREIRNFRD